MGKLVLLFWDFTYIYLKISEYDSRFSRVMACHTLWGRRVIDFHAHYVIMTLRTRRKVHKQRFKIQMSITDFQKLRIVIYFHFYLTSDVERSARSYKILLTKLN